MLFSLALSISTPVVCLVGVYVYVAEYTVRLVDGQVRIADCVVSVVAVVYFVAYGGLCIVDGPIFVVAVVVCIVVVVVVVADKLVRAADVVYLVVDYQGCPAERGKRREKTALLS